MEGRDERLDEKWKQIKVGDKRIVTTFVLF